MEGISRRNRQRAGLAIAIAALLLLGGSGRGGDAPSGPTASGPSASDTNASFPNSSVPNRAGPSVSDPNTSDPSALDPRLAGPAPSPRFTLIAGGDVLLDRGVRRALDETGDPDYPFGGIAPLLRRADVAFANLECALVDSGTAVMKLFMFRGDASLAASLRRCGLTALTLANNHSYDYGRSGLMATRETLRRNGIDVIGAGATQAEALAPTWVEAGGIRVALLGFVDLPLEGLMPMPELPGPACLDAASLIDSVRASRTRADLVVVTLHWGNEFRPLPSEEQAGLAARLAEAGADLIVGHHPHVIQTVARSGNAVVFYSVGNLVFDQTSAEGSEGLLVRVRAFDQDRGTVASGPASRPAGGGRHRWAYEFLPVRIDACRPRPASADQARRTAGALATRSGIVLAEPDAEGWWRVP